MKSATFVLLSVLWSFPSCASNEDVGSFLGRASAVGVVLIVSGSESLKTEIGAGCGVVYSGYVVNAVKSLNEGDLVSFRARSALQMSGAYLVFLTNETVSSADSSSILTGIRSDRCTESGIPLTAMIFGDGESTTIGPEAILERRRRPGGNRENYRNSDFYFFGDKLIKNMVDAVANEQQSGPIALDATVERANYIARGVAYHADSFLVFLRKQVRK